MYVPQFDVGNFSYPVIACDVDKLNTEWIGWKDAQDETYDKHNLIYDVPYEGMKRRQFEKANSDAPFLPKFPVFSPVKSWSRAQDEAAIEAAADDDIAENDDE